ncbi:MAG: hypothetical protein PWP49_254 [Thermococcaceae archaeon]|uniref:hypothetical protein n=1 Tax=Thermococcus litoralis TaxID=2265 RepID=UPI000B3573B8|nr:hypothetical protein [Thermococcus litoralis]MDK2853401.1 hypothetical protein [Thermococcaceae archaeon]MDN5319834.1 hypothetical protein [Thermococcaceae archaeon]
MVRKVGKVVIKINVPDGMEEFVRREVENFVKTLIEKEDLEELIKGFRSLKGILKTKKSAKELKAEVYDEAIY